MTRFYIRYKGIRAEGIYDEQRLKEVQASLNLLSGRRNAAWCSESYMVPIERFKITGCYCFDELVEVAPGCSGSTEPCKACFIPMFAGERDSEGLRSVELTLVTYKESVGHWDVIFNYSLVRRLGQERTGDIVFKITPSK